ncbi:unnamed protein product [Oncorhynchus mykiss]|uniref:Uncharacterized protein n=1 Tax=Oncorhynchus mykiss TaxID=8022 RepID=A0A060YRH2_ONCMY|nr:unnamed protein product [Oncorhynchus mykiss]
MLTTVSPLQANLPLLQRELLHCARLAKQNPAQYLAQHEQLLLDTSSTTSPVDSPELLLDLNDNGKRRTPDRTKVNGFDRDGPLHLETSSKRPCTISPAGQRFSPSNGLSYQPNGLAHGHPTPPPPPPPQHYRLDDMAITNHYRDSPHYRHPNHNHRELRERPRPLGKDGRRGLELGKGGRREGGGMWRTEKNRRRGGNVGIRVNRRVNRSCPSCKRSRCSTHKPERLF